MRLWTVAPAFLDGKGLVAQWREALLAKAVLEGKTKGYQNHPQLIRFRAHPEPVAAISAFLYPIFEESKCRGYKFDGDKLGPHVEVAPIVETEGQLAYEWQHLLQKLERRDPARFRDSEGVVPRAHPLFTIVPGDVKSWERVKD